MDTPITEKRYERQQEIVPLSALARTPVIIVGVGAIGRQVAIQAAAMGIPHLCLVDFDTVEEVNLGSQGFREKDVGKYKVDAVAEICREINSQIEIETVIDRFNQSHMIPGAIVICCVDKIDTREFLYAQVRRSMRAMIDGRMNAEVLRVITAHDQDTIEYYRKTLFAPEQTTPGRCTAKTTIFCASVAAGMMLSQLTKIIRNFPLEKDIMLNLLASTVEYNIDEIQQAA
ncbi:MAG: ThiF family adenylyltransferase [Planctomycetaceae bacterium]|nr:ThiF family adenylyltransferase [Planctomycetaceae bacterium]